MADVYRFLKDIYSGAESYKCYTQSGISTGDMCQWDADSRLATNNYLASGSIFLGVSEERQPLASLGTTAVPLTGDRMRIKSQGLHKFISTNGETYSHLDPVAQSGTNRQAVTKLIATRMIGRVHLPDGSQVSGDGSLEVPVIIYGTMTNVGRGPSALTGDR